MGMRMRTRIKRAWTKRRMESFRDTFSGGLGGLACALAGQPLDTVKVKRQTYPHVYPSSLQTLSKTFFEEGGLRAVYAGCGAAMATNVAENAVLFVCYERCLELVRWASGPGGDMSVMKQACAGSLASVASSVAITPLERIKCKMQVQIQQRPCGAGRLSNWSVVGAILQEEGVRGMFRGLTSTWAREVPGYFFFFGGYNGSLKLLSPAGEYRDHLSVWRLALAGGLAGCCFWTAIFPADVVKSRVQVNERISGSLWVSMLQIIRNEGFLALYRGLCPTLLRSFPANGALFVTYEYTRTLFIQSNENFSHH